MFKVIHNQTKEIHTVYAVEKDKNEGTLFLLNTDDSYSMWYWDNSDDYKPYKDEESVIQSIISEMYTDYNMYAEQGDNESCEVLGKFIKKLNLATD